MSAAEKALAALEAVCKNQTCAHYGPCGDCVTRETLAVNLSAPLAAVARAAMARPWVFCDKHGNEVGCHGCDAKPWNAWIDRRAHDERCRFAKIDAALDALEAAAEGVL